MNILATPGEVHVDPKNHLQEELQSFLEAFALLEHGVLPLEILKKIA